MTSTREVLAEQAHVMWAHWMKYQLSICEPHPDGHMIISAYKVGRWRRLLETPYADLTEAQRESDREKADRMIKALEEAGVISS